MPRPFGKCPNCGIRSRAAISHGKDGQIYIHYSATHLGGQGLVSLCARIRPDQEERLDQEINKSATVRAALDYFFKHRDTLLYKT